MPKYSAIYSVVLFAFENYREALSNVSVVIQDDLTERSYKLLSEAKDRLVKHDKTNKMGSKSIRRITPS